MKKFFSYLAFMAVLLGGLTLSSCTKKYTVIVKANHDAWGTVTGGGEYAANSEATLTAMPNPGYVFQKWDNGDSDNPKKVNVTANVTFTAIFVEVPSTPGVNVTFNNVPWRADDIDAEYDFNDGSWYVDAYPDMEAEYPCLSMLMYKHTPGVAVSSVNTEGILQNGDFGWIEYYKEAYMEDEEGSEYGDYWAKLATVNIYEFDATALVFSADVNATMFSAIEAFEGSAGSGPVGVDAASTAPMTVTMTKVQMEPYEGKLLGKRHDISKRHKTR